MGHTTMGVLGPQSERGKTVPATACCQLDSQGLFEQAWLALAFLACLSTAMGESAPNHTFRSRNPTHPYFYRTSVFLSRIST
ncbi:hypothetical protein Ddc_07323 [Ditylenchus destructor]|nr:hypothetical protein Ddc_07323 [Ditylenchus destructor]